MKSFPTTFLASGQLFGVLKITGTGPAAMVKPKLLVIVYPAIILMTFSTAGDSIMAVCIMMERPPPLASSPSMFIAFWRKLAMV